MREVNKADSAQIPVRFHNEAQDLIRDLARYNLIVTKDYDAWTVEETNFFLDVVQKARDLFNAVNGELRLLRESVTPKKRGRNGALLITPPSNSEDGAPSMAQFRRVENAQQGLWDQVLETQGEVRHIRE